MSPAAGTALMATSSTRASSWPSAVITASPTFCPAVIGAMSFFEKS